MSDRERQHSELVFALVGAVGVDLQRVSEALIQRLAHFGYEVEEIRLTEKVIPALAGGPAEGVSEFDRINGFMDAGNEARRRSGDNAVLAKGAAAVIAGGRHGKPPEQRPKRAYIIKSLKHPAEVDEFRRIYPLGFFLIGVYTDEGRRKKYLVDVKNMTEDEAQQLVERDEGEPLDHGQKVIETFHLSDFFLHVDGDCDRLDRSVWRILDLVFGHPFVTPTFDEYAMFLAFAASLRSADLSRQVGAVIARNNQVLGTGANDCPAYGGGLYWPYYDWDTKEILDVPQGRDHTRGYDSNRTEQRKIIDDVIQRAELSDVEQDRVRAGLEQSRIRDLTEFGRAVHAEMEALLSCGRAGVSTRAATLYTTTFPCHNCAKHIVAAGIHRVVFIEPYEKSKAIDLHGDSIEVSIRETDEKVNFAPFVGVGPRRFFDLFSIRLGSGRPVSRKDNGRTAQWDRADGIPRLQMLPHSYLDHEASAAELFLQAEETMKEETPDG